jgi:uncharacterized protein (DUF1800 family)
VDFERHPDPTLAPEWAKPDPTRAQRMAQMRSASAEERRELQREEQRLQRERTQELRHWWLLRMAKGPRPLQEKMTLFWHGHFATSVQKVRDSYLMWRQNETFRQHATGEWLELLTAVARDPAMLVWLDQAQSRREHPNENFAREVMELFTLGEGHYSETDVTEAARAFTGWSFDRARQEFVRRPRMHDPGIKTVLGRSGSLDGDAVLAQIVAQPQSSRFICGKLWNFFAGQEASPELITALVEVFEGNGRRFQPLLNALFSSAEFYSDSVIRQQVKSPVQWLVGSVRMLETELPPATVSANALRLLGQELFAPPNVKGWDGGLSWITTNNLLNRYNLAGLLVLGESPLTTQRDRPRRKNLEGRRRREMTSRTSVDLKNVFTARDRSSPDNVIATLERRFLHAPLQERQVRTLRDYLNSQGELDDADLLHAIRLIMCTPEYQLT